MRKGYVNKIQKNLGSNHSLFLLWIVVIFNFFIFKQIHVYTYVYKKLFIMNLQIENSCYFLFL